MNINLNGIEAKAQINLRKHRIAFERAATIFQDSKALSQYDVDHSHQEDRWITLGIDHAGILLVVCHMFKEQGATKARIRIFLARKATKNETQQYRRD